MRSSPRRPLILKRRKLNLSLKDGVRSRGFPEPRPPSLTKSEERHEQNVTRDVDITAEHNQVEKTRMVARPELSLTNATVISSTPDRNQLSETIVCPIQRQNNTLQVSASSAPQSAGVSTESTPGIKVMGHPTIPNTQLVVLPPDSDMESIIQALTVRGREKGAPQKFILISGNPSIHTQAEKLGFQSKAEEMATLQIEATTSSQECVNQKPRGNKADDCCIMGLSYASIKAKPRTPPGL